MHSRSVLSQGPDGCFNWGIMQPSNSDGILRAKQKRFLACFAACGSLTNAARWTKIHRQTHYDWMSNSPGYPEAFKEAEDRSIRVLEDEAVRRAHEGIRRPVRYKGKIVGYETEYSDSLLMFTIKAGKPEKYRERFDQRHTGPDGKPVLGEFQDLVAMMRRGA